MAEDGVCPSCGARVNITQTACPQCGVPIVWGPPEMGPPMHTTAQMPQQHVYPPYQQTYVLKGARSRIWPLLLFLSPLIILMGTSAPWVEVDIFIWEKEGNLNDFDNAFETGFMGGFVLFSILLMFFGFISLIVYNRLLKFLAVLLSFLTILLTLSAINEVSNEMNETVGSKNWDFGPGPFMTLIGCLLATVSSIMIKGERSIGYLQPSPTAGRPPF